MHVAALSFLIWASVFSVLPIAACARYGALNAARWVALIVTGVTFVVSLVMWAHFDTSLTTMQFQEHASWIPALKINYDLGIDGISLALIALSCFTNIIIIAASWKMVNKQVGAYLSAFMLMQGLVIGVFASLDAMLFYFFWEAMLIPMFLIIGIWGAKNRAYAAIKFFLFTFLGSALLLITLIYLRVHAGSFSILQFYQLPMSLHVQIWVFFGLLLAFAIKVPMWPVHTWLPDAHTEAPTGGSVLLAALLLKLGTYGFLRFILPIVPDACRFLVWWLIALSLAAVVYVGLIAIVQKDMKRLIAYSSIAHMGFVTLGCFVAVYVLQYSGNANDALLATDGAMFQMISHGFSSGALFLAFGMIYQQMHTRKIEDFGGIANVMPYYAAFFMVFAMANVGLPGTSGFVGEFMVIVSAFKVNFWVSLLAATSLFIGASYTLWMYKRVFYGEVKHEAVRALQPIGWLEKSLLALLAIAVIFFGIYPAPLLNLFHTSVAQVLHYATATKLT